MLEKVLGRNIYNDSFLQDSCIEVVATDDLDKNNGLDNTSFLFIRSEDLLNSLSDEQRNLLNKDVLSIYNLFEDERFIRIYFKGDHKELMSLIEKMYFESKINASMLRILIQVGLIKLTSRDYQRFGEIGLLYSWDDPYVMDFYSSEEEMSEAFKTVHGIK